MSTQTMSISAKDVKRLREATGVGMMDCKKALQEADGDFDKAIELLRKKGQKVAAKRADRDAKEGVIVTASSGDSTSVIVEVNCETDFVARNEDFQKFADDIAALILEKRPADMDEFRALPFRGTTASESISEMTGKIGEKIDVRRFSILHSADGAAVSYIHPGARLGVLVEILGNGESKAIGRDVAMQVAALKPVAVDRDGVSEEVKAKEMEIAREIAIKEGKPENIVERIATGKLDRYFKDNVLTEQPFVKDSSVRVGELLENAGLSVKQYVRFALGE